MAETFQLGDIVASSGGAWGRKLPETKMGSINTKAYEKGVISEIFYGRADATDPKQVRWLDDNDVKGLSKLTPEEQKTIRVCFYITIPEKGGLVRTGGMAISMHEKATLPKIVAAALGKGKTISNVNQLIGKEIEVLCTKKQGNKGTIYPAIQAYGEKEEVAWEE